MSIYPRERISEALQDSANRGIAMVIAPAGFGKTEAVIDAFGATAHFVELSDAGASVEGIARDVIAAAAPESSRALGPLLARAANDENRAHLMSWVAARLRAVEQPIVLDDFQRICGDAAAVAFVRDIIGATVPNVRWVLASRETPELPIGTWLARDYMTLPISTDDLAFDVPEATGVAAAMDVEIDESSLDEMVRDVTGWPLAVRLSLGAWERTRLLPPLRIRTRSVLFDFLETEVWSRLSDPEREFFRAAAQLTDLQPRVLGAAGFPDSRLALDRMHRRLPLLSKIGNGSFRLHDLFRDFILERTRTDAAADAALVKRLARALERFGSFEDALAMLVRSEDWEGALGLLARRGIDRIESGHRADIMAILGRFPRRLRDHPVVTGLRGYALAIDGAFDLAKREIEAALAGELDPSLRGPLQLQRGNMAFNMRDYATAVTIHRATMGDERFDGETRMKGAASLALACAAAGDRDAARDAMVFCAAGLEDGSVEMRALVRHRLAFAHTVLGEFALAEHYATECVQLAHSVGLESIAARAYSILVNVATMLYSDTLLARRYAEACRASAESSGDRALHVFALEMLVFIAGTQGDDELFESSDTQLRALAGRAPTRNAVWRNFFSALREAGLGRNDSAVGELRRTLRGTTTPAEVAFTNAVLAVLYASSDPAKAEALLEKPVLVTADSNTEAVRFLMYAQTYHALGQWLIGRGRAARRARMPNANDLPPGDAAIITVIATICSTSRQTITSRQLDQLTEPLIALGMDGYARFLRTVLAKASVHELTRTELDVLRALRSGGTTSEVAERLGKSSHTVLSHIKSACAKLGCSGRLAAVTLAVDQGWIE